jgi:hypothetical protein
MKKIVLAAVTVVVLSSGIIMVMKADKKQPETPKPNFVETTKEERISKESGERVVVETPVLPPQVEIKPQPTKVVEEAPEPVDIKTYARNLLEYRTGRNQEHFWVCFDDLMQQAHEWDLSEADIDKIVDRMTVFTSTCSALGLYKQAGTYH